VATRSLEEAAELLLLVELATGSVKKYFLNSKSLLLIVLMSGCLKELVKHIVQEGFSLKFSSIESL